MYPVSLGYDEAKHRITKLLENRHDAEALLTSVFTFEKTVRRMLRFFAVRRGFTSKQSEVLFCKMGFGQLKEVWPCFEAENRTLPAMVGEKIWQNVPASVSMRNKIVHGEQVFKLATCRLQAQYMLAALDALRNNALQDTNFDGWSRLPVRRKSLVGWHAP